MGTTDDELLCQTRVCEVRRTSADTVAVKLGAVSLTLDEREFAALAGSLRNAARRLFGGRREQRGRFAVIEGALEEASAPADETAPAARRPELALLLSPPAPEPE